MKDKVALITGGTKGIGYAIAEALLREGASVFVCSRTREDVESAVERLTQIGSVAGKLCDVRSDDQVKAVVESCQKRFGSIDILINNAGIGINGKTVEEITPEEFRQTLETNLFGVYHFCHHAIPVMRQK